MLTPITQTTFHLLDSFLTSTFKCSTKGQLRIVHTADHQLPTQKPSNPKPSSPSPSIPLTDSKSNINSINPPIHTPHYLLPPPRTEEGAQQRMETSGRRGRGVGVSRLCDWVGKLGSRAFGMA